MNIQNQFDVDLQDLANTPNQGRTILFETVYGSKLYGCDVEGSDHDIRGIYMSSLYDFLREAKEEVAVLTPDADLGESDDIVYFPAGMFIDQVLRMKVNCVEIYFAALQARRNGAEMHPVMNMILDAKDEIISADHAGFIGHARQRAAKYIEGDDPADMTLQANRHALKCLQEAAKSSLDAPAKQICDMPDLIERMQEHSSIKAGMNKAQDEVLFINARQLAFNTRIAEAIRVTEQRLERFTRKNLDADPKQIYKDLCTSLRMMETAAELMETGDISFPRPRAEYYREIRSGKVDRKAILEQIDTAQQRAVAIVESGKSPLRPAWLEGDHVPTRNNLVARVRLYALKQLSLT
jgi:predicted nucleotidyltransferase